MSVAGPPDDYTDQLKEAAYEVLSMTDVFALLDERETTHGDFGDLAAIAQGLKEAMEKGRNWERLSSDKKEALQHIATKIARILNGNPECRDHWEDIAGYVTLVAKTLKEDENA